MIIKIFAVLLFIFQLAIRLQAEPLVQVATHTGNPLFVDQRITKGRRQNPIVLPQTFSPGTIAKTSKNANLSYLSSLRQPPRGLVVNSQSEKPINGTSNSILKNYSMSDLLHTPSVKTFVFEMKNGEPEELSETTPTAYSELKSDKCYTFVQENSSTTNSPHYDIYYWIGKDSTENDAAAAASCAVAIDSKVHLRMRIYREAEGHESEAFKTLFPQDNFEMVSSNDEIHPRENTGDELMEKRLGDEMKVIRIYQKNYRFEKNDISEDHIPFDQFHADDCYLIDSRDQNVGLFLWMGKETKYSLGLRRESARQAELYLREQPEYNYTTPITFIDEDDGPRFVEEMVAFLSGNII